PQADQPSDARPQAAAEWPDAKGRTVQISLALLHATLPPALEQRRKLPAPMCETGKAKREFQSRQATAGRCDVVRLLGLDPSRRQPAMRECQNCANPAERFDKAGSGQAVK